ncbi:MAG: DUF86 domain-containing protein [Chlamydiae bacterium]|nr:DUF86 domain-containing protein [Chlamydiota bacterium]
MALDKEILAERLGALERHLLRVSARLPNNRADFLPGTDFSDAVILHLWQAVQLTIDTALAACVRLNLGTPTSYANAFFKLSEAGYLDKELAVRLAHAAGFRNRIVHAYEDLDMQKIYIIAQEGAKDLRAFFASIRDLLSAKK